MVQALEYGVHSHLEGARGGFSPPRIRMAYSGFSYNTVDLFSCREDFYPRIVMLLMCVPQNTKL